MVPSLNEMKRNGYIYNSLEVVRTEMLLRMKTAANRSFLAEKHEKGTAQLTINSTGEPPLLAEVELHPILCPDATAATYIPQVLSQHPAPGRLLVDEVEGSIEA